MKKTIAAALLTLICIFCYANDYENAWKAIQAKDFKEAKSLLMKATKNPATALDAYMTLLYIRTYEGNESEIPGLVDELLKHEGRDAYLFATWFNGSILGQYGKKEPHQLNLLNKILSSGSFNGSLQSAAHYVKAMHHLYSHDYSKAKQEWALTGAIQDWQLTGPFENLSGSGFNSEFGPLKSPGPNAKFKAANNVDVQWFTPLRLNREGWTFTYSHLPNSSAIIYAQTFVNSPDDMDVLINAGCNGSLKVWVNDGLVLSESRERTTELDYYKNHCKLKKGYNRVLVQLGYTDNTSPNFIIRFTDDKFNPVKGLTVSTELQSYPKASDAASTKSIKHFAELYFEKKVAAGPNNLVNYILLAQAYLRNQRVSEARSTIEKALKLSPDNSLLKFELIQSLIKAGNRTLLLQEVDWLKENDPESFLNYQLKIQNLIDEEKYTEAEEVLNKMEKLYREDASTMSTRLTILAKMEKVEDLLKLVDKAHKAYPDNTEFLSMKFRIEKLLMKNNKGAINIYEKFLKNNYNYSIITNLADEYKDIGQTNKYLDILEELYKEWGADPRFAKALSKYWYEKRNFKKALQYGLEAIQLAPYNGRHWENVATIQEEMGNKDEAIESYKKALYYDRTNYDVRKKLNMLQNKPDLYKLLPEVEPYAIIRQAPINKEYNFTYLIDEKAAIIYEEGASEEYTTYAVKLNTEKGIDTWKEIYLSYSYSTQDLLVEKAEVVKANGSKVTAERDDDHVVFPGLEVGDAIYVKYRVQNYSRGRLGREFYDQFTMNSFVPSRHARYTLVAPKDYKFNWHLTNSDLQPATKPAGEYKVYTWELKDVAALKSEPLMPNLNDVGVVLHISSIKSWSDVAQWYSDLSYQDLRDNVELNNLYAEIFPDDKKMSNLEKARKIYDYIVTNIRYSSVDFRQSGLVPQEISKIISTRLGDCKDMSMLYVALAKMAGIPAQLVLIDTRDNGTKDMILPTMGFNHCIAMAKIDGKDYYIELTDSKLPFGSLGNNLTGALSLLVPNHGEKANAELKPLQAPAKTPDRSIRNINVTVTGKDIRLNVVTKRYGSLTSGWREDYSTLPPEKQREEYEQTISNGYKNPVKLESLEFEGLNDLGDSLITKYTYTVKNEVVEAGSMRMLKVPYIDLVATLENFTADERKFPIEYWKYENVDEYETVITIQLPTGQKFIEIPQNVNLSFKGITYSLKFTKEGEKLKIHRKAKMQRDNIQPSDYAAFKKFFNDIVEAETKYVVFK